MNKQEEQAIERIKNNVPEMKSIETSLKNSIETRYFLFLAILLGLITSVLGNIIYNDVILTFGKTGQIIHKAAFIILFPICIYLLYRTVRKEYKMYNEMKNLREFTEKYLENHSKGPR